MTDFTILLLGYLGAGFFFGSAAFCSHISSNYPRDYAVQEGLKFALLWGLFAIPLLCSFWADWLERMARR